MIIAFFEGIHSKPILDNSIFVLTNISLYFDFAFFHIKINFPIYSAEVSAPKIFVELGIFFKI